MHIAKIIKSNSHVDYAARVLDALDTPTPPTTADYRFGQFVKVATSGVEVVGFFSAYGDGSYRYLFLSDAPIKVRALKGLAETHDSAAHF